MIKYETMNPLQNLAAWLVNTGIVDTSGEAGALAIAVSMFTAAAIAIAAAAILEERQL